MEEKEIVRKSVPIPNKWLKELLDFFRDRRRSVSCLDVVSSCTEQGIRIPL